MNRRAEENLYEIHVCICVHGSAYYCRKMLETYKKKQAERLVLLGDLLYHGPRNDLPKEYAPKEVIQNALMV